MVVAIESEPDGVIQERSPGRQVQLALHDTGETVVALATPDTTKVVRYPFGGSGAIARRWVTLRTLDLLRRHALAQLRTVPMPLPDEAGSKKENMDE